MRIVYPKKIAIGVDIGGTKIKAGLVDINGQIIGIPESIRTLAHEPGEMIIEQLTLLIRRMIQQADGAELIGIGIGSTGPLDINKGIILECNNLPTLHNYPLHKKNRINFRTSGQTG
ncbi:ROK family protein [Bacteroides thetaiotaomicron]|uniref:ROK family protein n=1 Tax=Bacteroides thetaiotaomicron TaxID=818 RepID=UPI0039C35DB2